MNVEPQAAAAPPDFMVPDQPLFDTAEETQQVPEEPEEPIEEEPSLNNKFSFPISYENFQKFLKMPDPLAILDHFLIGIYNDSPTPIEVDPADPLELISNKLIDSLAENLVLPEQAYVVIQENIDVLALLYQVMWIKSISFRQLDNTGDSFVNEVVLPNLIENLGSDKVAVNHLKKAAAKFFGDYKEEDLAVVSFNLNDVPSLRHIVPLMNVHALSSYDIPANVYNSKITSLSTLANMDMPQKFRNKNLKYNISDNPFVFVVNSALLHKQLFVLSFDLQSELTFMTKKIDLRLSDYSKLASAMPHLESLVNKDMKMEQYVKEYVEQNSGLFQRDPIEMAELLFGLHIYAKDRVLATARIRWAQIVKSAMATNLSDWRAELDIWVTENLSSRSNAPSNLGWT